MKTPYFVFCALIFIVSCDDEEKKATGIRAKIGGIEWVAKEVFVETPPANPAVISKLTAVDANGFQMIFSFTKLGITASNASAQFRQRTATLNFFEYELVTDSEIKLKWQTESESNLNFFEVQWSWDGVSWNYHTSVFAFGNTSSPTDYSTFANFNLAGEQSMFFRLVMYDTDGSTTTSEPLTVSLSYPVAVKNGLSGVKLQCYDGNLMLTKYDSEKKLISGTFSFTYKTSFGVEVAITDGEIYNVSY
jgi:hypothetical protein